MTLRSWYEEPIAKHHDRQNFDCSDVALNTFLQRYARQHHEQGGAKTFVAVDKDNPKAIQGFYTLSPACLSYARTPDILQRGLARYDVPDFRLARLAVASVKQGQGLGGQLLLAAGQRCLLVSQEIGGLMLIIDAKNARVATWYKRYGAIALSDTPLTLVIPLATLRMTLEKLNH